MNPIDGDYVRDEILYGEAYVPDELAVYIKRVFDEAPTIEAEVVKHSRWGELDYDFDTDTYTRPCSNCGYKSAEYSKSYCPNCGAKMDLEE